MAVHLFKLDEGITANARVGGESVQIGIHKRGNQFFFKCGSQIQDFKRNFKVFRDFSDP